MFVMMKNIGFSGVKELLRDLRNPRKCQIESVRKLKPPYAIVERLTPRPFSNSTVEYFRDSLPVPLNTNMTP